MTIIEFFKIQLADEAIATRKMLAQIPHDKFDWQPHKKSMTIQQLSNHIVELPTWIGMAIFSDELDFANNPYKPTAFRKSTELLKYFEEILEKAYKDLDNASDDILTQRWVLREGDVIYWDTTKGECIRMAISQIIHHRAQLGVCLRLLDVPIPGSYGPSADEEVFNNSEASTFV